jgi:hypothetical protein
MQLYLFWSKGDPEIFGFTLDRTGENLPTDFEPWSANGAGDALYADLEGRAQPNAIVRIVERDGFYLGRCGR